MPKSIDSAGIPSWVLLRKQRLGLGLRRHRRWVGNDIVLMFHVWPEPRQSVQMVLTTAGEGRCSACEDGVQSG